MELYVAGKSRWPELELTFETFRQHCLTLGAPWTSSSEVYAADLFLCCACLHGVAGAGGALQREGAVAVRTAINRVSHDSEFVEEVTQDLWNKLLVGPEAKVAYYSGRGPLNGWLRVAATRAALDHARQQKAARLRHAELSAALPAAGLGPDIHLLQERYREAFSSAFKSALASLSAQERNVLRLHLKHGCTIDQIGKAYNVHRATAARWLERARARVYIAIRQELQRQHGPMTDGELKSLARVIGSNFDLSFFEQTRSSQ